MSCYHTLYGTTNGDFVKRFWDKKRKILSVLCADYVCIKSKIFRQFTQPKKAKTLPPTGKPQDPWRYPPGGGRSSRPTHPPPPGVQTLKNLKIPACHTHFKTLHSPCNPPRDIYTSLLTSLPRCIPHNCNAFFFWNCSFQIQKCLLKKTSCLDLKCTF